jgi:hypothetical protein
MDPYKATQKTICKFVERYQLFAFLGLCNVSGVLRTRMEPVVNMWTINAAYVMPIFRATMETDQSYQILCVIHSMTKLQEINRQISFNQRCI